jgi:hypothetical protein
MESFVVRRDKKVKVRPHPDKYADVAFGSVLELWQPVYNEYLKCEKEALEAYDLHTEEAADRCIVLQSRAEQLKKEFVPIRDLHHKLNSALVVAEREAVFCRAEHKFVVGIVWRKLTIAIKRRLNKYMQKSAADAEERKRKRTASAEGGATPSEVATVAAAPPTPVPALGKRNGVEAEPGKTLENHACERKRAVQKYSAKGKGKRAGSWKTEVSKRRTTALSGQRLENAGCKIKDVKLAYKWHGKIFKSYCGHTFVIRFDRIWCMCCSVYLDPRDLAQHIHGRKKAFLAGKMTVHAKNLATFEHKGSTQNDIVVAIQQWETRDQPQGRGLAQQTKEFRFAVVDMAYDIDLTADQLAKARPRLERWAKESMGSVLGGNGVMKFGEAVEIKESNARNKLLAGCFAEFGFIFDGTPTFADAEAVLFTVVDRLTWRLMQVLVRVRFLVRSLNGDGTCEMLEDTIADTPMKAENARIALCDRCATNLAGIRIFNEQGFPVRNCTVGPCASHTVVHSGDNFNAPISARFFKLYTKMVKNPGSVARIVIFEVFGY